MSKEIVPFSDPATVFEVTDGAIVNHLCLPVGTDTERIGMKLDRLQSLTRWAGAKQLMLVNADLGYERPDMFDIQDNGGGLATAKGLKKSPKHKLNDHVYDDRNNIGKTSILYGQVDRTDNALTAAFKADSLALYFDTQGLKDKVADHPKNKKGVIDEAVWTSVLDAEIRRGIVSAAYNRYVHGSYFYGIAEPAASLMFYQGIFEYINTGNNKSLAAFALGFKTLQLCTQARRATRFGEGLQDANWTAQIYTTTRTDRMIATNLSSKLGGKTLKLL